MIIAELCRACGRPRGAGPVGSPTRCPYDHEGRSASAVASRSERGSFTPTRVTTSARLLSWPSDRLLSVPRSRKPRSIESAGALMWLRVGELRQRRERVELAPRGDRTRSVDALCADVHRRPDVGVAVEQVQRLAVVGHLVATVGPPDDP